MKGMSRGRDSLVSRIENDALDEGVTVASALRKCLVLGGESGSRQLRDWATRELQGYAGVDDLPPYRVIMAPLMVDGIAGNYQVTGQQLPASAIPDFARDVVSERLELRYGVGSIEALLDQAEIKLQPPSASDLTRYMNAIDGSPYQHIVSLYWSVSHSAVRGVLDQIRTALTQLVAELRASMTDSDDVPSADAANQAVSVVVSGERSTVHVTTAQASGTGSTATAKAAHAELTDLLAELETLLRVEGDAPAAETAAHLATVVEQPRRDDGKIRRLWGAIKVAATTNEALALVARIAPLLLTSGSHHS